MVNTRPPTIYDVARSAGVSKSLVSLVLRGSPSVSEARRTAVLEAVERLGYRPSQAAAALAGATTRTIGVVIDDWRNLWFVELLRGLQEGLAPHGLRIAVADHTLNAHVEAHPLDGFLSMRVDGLVIATEPTGAMRVPEGLPVVVAGHREGVVPGAEVVANDDRLGARLATEHLIGLRHASICYLGGPEASYANGMRWRGCNGRPATSWTMIRASPGLATFCAVPAWTNCPSFGT